MELFKHWVGSRSPRILFVGEAFGETEEQTGVPFSGFAGREFTRLAARAFEDGAETLSLMQRWGTSWTSAREEWFKQISLGVTNVFNLRPRDNKLIHLCYGDKSARPKDYALPPITTILGRGQVFLREEYTSEVERLWEEISYAKPNLIVPLGNTACWAILSSLNISQIRGTVTISSPVLPSNERFGKFKVLPTFHPSAILQGMHKWRPIVQADFIKARGEGEGEEISRPSRIIMVNPTLVDIKTYAFAVAKDPEMACDTETAKGQITRVSFATSPHLALVIPFRDKECKSNYWTTREEEIEAWKWVKFLLGLPCAKVFQNGLYDLQFFAKMGIRVNNFVDDTLILHHGLYLEMQKSLGFLGSIYTNEPAWKLMRLRRKERGEKEDE